jgi:hypothetical protein
LTEEQLKALIAIYNDEGDKTTAKALGDAWGGFYGVTDEDGNVITEGTRKLKDAQFTAKDSGGWNGFGGINRDAVVVDPHTNEEYELSKLAQALVDDGSFDNLAQAKAWIRENQESWGVNTKWFSKG